MEKFVCDISLTFRDKSITKYYFDECMTSMSEYIRNSTRYSFQENQFFKELPPSLKRKLTFTVLSKQMQTFEFFF